jgi:hypothetical protein
MSYEQQQAQSKLGNNKAVFYYMYPPSLGLHRNRSKPQLPSPDLPHRYFLAICPTGHQM